VNAPDGLDRADAHDTIDPIEQIRIKFSPAARRSRAVSGPIGSTAMLAAPRGHVFVAAILTAKTSGRFLVLARGDAVVGPGSAGMSLSLVASVARSRGAPIVFDNAIQVGLGVLASSGSLPLMFRPSEAAFRHRLISAQALEAGEQVPPWSFEALAGAGGDDAVGIGETVAYSIVATSAASLTLRGVRVEAFELPADARIPALH
jgi:hypothetical protein